MPSVELTEDQLCRLSDALLDDLNPADWPDVLDIFDQALQEFYPIVWAKDEEELDVRESLSFNPEDPLY